MIEKTNYTKETMVLKPERISSRRVYFPGLTGVRFFAALAVIFCHIEEFKHFFNVRSNEYFDVHLFTLLGEVSVTLFFVLSGFLITYLLLAEKEKTGMIAMRDFYLRRVYRIFPLYYLIVFLGLFVFPYFPIFDFPVWSDYIDSSFGYKVVMYLFFLSNFALVSIFPIPYVVHTWSISVEEQFYLLWPWLVTKFKQPLYAFIGVIIIYLIIAKGVWFLSDLYEGKNRVLQVLKDVLRYTRMDTMAIGGIGAYFVFHRGKEFFKPIYSIGAQIATYILAFTFLFFQVDFGYFAQEIYAVLFLSVILNLSCNPKSIFKFEHPVLKYLGKISYGIYMYHYFIVRLCMIIIQSIFGANIFPTVGGDIMLYVLSVGLTLAVSALSYEYFEKPFLKLKKKFAIIKSGEPIHEKKAV